MTSERQAAANVTVALHGYFNRAYSGRRQQTMLLPPALAVTPRAVVAHLSIPAGAVGLTLINGRQASLDDPLRAGDRLDILPLLGGG